MTDRKSNITYSDNERMPVQGAIDLRLALHKGEAKNLRTMLLQKRANEFKSMCQESISASDFGKKPSKKLGEAQNILVQ